MSDQLDRLKLKELAEYTAFRCVPENRNLNTLKCKYCGRSWWFEHRTMEICSVRGENHIRTIRTALPALIAENERLEGELAEARKERDLIGGRHNKRANTAEAERDEARTELAEARKPNQRLYDLVRHQRMELHEAELVTDEEYIELAKEHSAVARLEDYDAIRLQRDQSRLQRDEARKRCETLAAALHGIIDAEGASAQYEAVVKARAALASEQEGKS